MNRILVNEQHEFDVEMEDILQINGEEVDFSWVRINKQEFHVLYRGKSYRLTLNSRSLDGKQMSFEIEGKTFETKLKDELDQLIDRMGMKQAEAMVNDLKAPMPGLVLEVAIQVGDQVEKDQTLLVLEAMKMENVIKAPADAVVSAIEVSTGDKVDKNQILVRFGE
jgi:biotin carboxyl carrier protein